jgi:ubiquinone/menaquinone biosynthesis C-methylase UbiE
MPKNRNRDDTPISFNYGNIQTDEEWATSRVYEDNSWRTEFNLSLEHPHRTLLVEKISSYGPISSILEIGCGHGPNLYLLAKKFPDAKIVGLDINPMAVATGQEFFKEKRITNVRFDVGKIQELRRFEDKSFDVVLTDSILIYIQPNEIIPVVRELLRVGKVVILNEWHCFHKFKALCIDTYFCLKLKYESMKFSKENVSLLRCLFASKSFSLGIYIGHWVRNYADLFGQFVPRKNITVTKTPKEYWDDKKWQKWGAIIEVDAR